MGRPLILLARHRRIIHLRVDLTLRQAHIEGYARGSWQVRALARARLLYPGLFRRVGLRASLRFSHPVTAAISGGYWTRPLMRGS
jgi:hypothetical protein